MTQLHEEGKMIFSDIKLQLNPLQIQFSTPKAGQFKIRKNYNL